MTSDDLTLDVLKSIRDEIRQTNGRIDQTNRRLDETNTQLQSLREETNGQTRSLREELSRRIVESELHTATAITELAGTVRDMTAFLRDALALLPRVAHCEHEIDAIKHRLSPAQR